MTASPEHEYDAAYEYNAHGIITPSTTCRPNIWSPSGTLILGSHKGQGLMADNVGGRERQHVGRLLSGDAAKVVLRDHLMS